MAETIVAAAIRIPAKDGGLLTISDIPPVRHHQLMHSAFHWLGRCVLPDEQGFLTSIGRYVWREEALRLAIAAGQVDKRLRKSGAFGSSQLFSEDLW